MRPELPEQTLQRLNPSTVRWYAVQAGWKPVSGVKRPVIVLNHPTDELIQIQIPTGGSEREVGYLMRHVLERLAEMENRPARDVLNDLLLGPTDRLRLAVESTGTESGTLPVEEGLRLFQGGRDLLLAAACSAHQPQAFYPRQSFTEAQEFIRRCRFG